VKAGRHATAALRRRPSAAAQLALSPGRRRTRRSLPFPTRAPSNALTAPSPCLTFRSREARARSKPDSHTHTARPITLLFARAREKQQQSKPRASLRPVVPPRRAPSPDCPGAQRASRVCGHRNRPPVQRRALDPARRAPKAGERTSEQKEEGEDDSQPRPLISPRLPLAARGQPPSSDAGPAHARAPPTPHHRGGGRGRQKAGA
jgi:hypothetical protein